MGFRNCSIEVRSVRDIHIVYIYEQRKPHAPIFVKHASNAEEALEVVKRTDWVQRHP
jgi:hypothetical protein